MSVHRLRSQLADLGVLVLLGVWFLTFAPTVVGGPAAYIEVSGHSMDGTYLTGDLVVTRKHDTYEVGDIVAFRVNGGGQVIHRIIGGDGVRGYDMQGDNNPDPDPWHPTDEDVVGTAWIHLPQKAWILHLPRQPWFAGLSAGLVTLLVLGWDARPRKRPEDGTAAEAGLRPTPESTREPERTPEPVLVPAGAPRSGTAIPAQRSGSAAPARTAAPAGRLVPSPTSARRIPTQRVPGTVLRPTGRRVAPPPRREVAR